MSMPSYATATGRRSRTRTTNARAAAGARGIYVYDSSARKLDIDNAMEADSRREQLYKARRTREKARHMNPGYVLFLAAALIVSAFVLIGYVKLRSDITASISNISTLESRLNAIRQSNDEEYSRIENSVSLEEVKKVAIEQLGMTYAAEGQVVRYVPAEADYVRQVGEIPQ